jgi:hypothetical protein
MIVKFVMHQNESIQIKLSQIFQKIGAFRILSSEMTIHMLVGGYSIA